MATINTLSKAVIYSTILDEVIRAGLTSSFMENASVQYTGGSSCQIPKMSVGGYGTYDRGTTGYPTGAVTLTYETKTISMDRGIRFVLDAQDEDETKNVLSATNVMTQFAKTQSIPELDSYRYSTIFQNIVDETVAIYGYYTPAVGTLLTAVQGKIADIQNILGEGEPLVCVMSGECFKFFTNSTELTKYLSVQSVTGANGITTKIYSIDGVQIIPVPSARMKTEYAFSATNGFSAKAWAQSINFIVMAKSAAVGFVKANKMKVISEDVNPSSDGELVASRLVHDCWVMDNKKESIYVSLKPATIAGFSAAELLTTGATNVTYTIASYATRDTGHKFYYYDGGTGAAITAPATYDDMTLTGYVEITSASPVADVVTSSYYGALLEIDENGRAVRFQTIKAA